MTKTIFREITIIILLIVSIGLLLTIAFYDYIPNSKVIPANVVAYTVENDVQEEISNTTINATQNIIKTYRVEETDLSNYEKANIYDKGKENPFAASQNDTPSVNTSLENISNTTNDVYLGK